MPVPLIEPGFAARGERLGHGAETAVAGAELADGGGERRGIEIGPHAGREDQLGIGAFPEEEIAETALTASADEEVDGRTEGGDDKSRHMGRANRSMLNASGVGVTTAAM